MFHVDSPLESSIESSTDRSTSPLKSLFHCKALEVTAYDFPSGRIARQASVELVLVGDSLGNCRLGLSDTVGVTMEDMLRATKAVRRGVDVAGTAKSPKPLVIGVEPGMS